jgi:hypothetical protein
MFSQRVPAFAGRHGVRITNYVFERAFVVSTDGFTLVFRILRSAFCVGTERSAFMDSDFRIGFRLMVRYMFNGYGFLFQRIKGSVFLGFGFGFQ